MGASPEAVGMSAERLERIHPVMVGIDLPEQDLRALTYQAIID